MTSIVLTPEKFGAQGVGSTGARADTNAFAKMVKQILANPTKIYEIRLLPGAIYCLGYGLDMSPAQVTAATAAGQLTKAEQTVIAYRSGWILDGVKNVTVGCVAGTPKSQWAVLKVTPGNFLENWATKPTVNLMLAGRNGIVKNLRFNRVVLDGSASDSNKTMDTQQSNLISCGTKGVDGLHLGGIGLDDGVTIRNVAADGVKTVSGTKNVKFQKVFASLMGRAALVIQNNTSDFIIEDCDGDENFKAWLDAEPTGNGPGPSNVSIKRTNLFCGVTGDPVRRPDYSASFAGINPLARMTNAVVEDCKVDSGTWMYNVEITFRRCRFNTLAVVPGFHDAVRAEELVHAEFFDCIFDAVDLALYGTHHNSLGNIPSKLWIHGGTMNVLDRAISLDSAQGLWLDGVTIIQRAGTQPPVFVTGTMIGQNLRGFKFTNVTYNLARPLCKIQSRDDGLRANIRYYDLEATGCGPTPFQLIGPVGSEADVTAGLARIETPIIVP